MNKYIRVIKNFCADKTIRFSYLTKLGVFNGLSDEQYLKLKYKNVVGRNLDLENPKTFNEKLQSVSADSWSLWSDRRFFAYRRAFFLCGCDSVFFGGAMSGQWNQAEFFSVDQHCVRGRKKICGC